MRSAPSAADARTAERCPQARRLDRVRAYSRVSDSTKGFCMDVHSHKKGFGHARPLAIRTCNRPTAYLVSGSLRPARSSGRRAGTGRALLPLMLLHPPQALGQPRHCSQFRQSWGDWYQGSEAATSSELRAADRHGSVQPRPPMRPGQWHPRQPLGGVQVLGSARRCEGAKRGYSAYGRVAIRRRSAAARTLAHNPLRKSRRVLSERRSRPPPVPHPRTPHARRGSGGQGRRARLVHRESVRTREH